MIHRKAVNNRKLINKQHKERNNRKSGESPGKAAAIMYEKYHTTYENMRNENEKSFAGELEFNERLFFRKEQKRKR